MSLSEKDQGDLMGWWILGVVVLVLASLLQNNAMNARFDSLEAQIEELQQ